MIKGIYTAASGMINMLTANDGIANNLANINTPGFKQGVTLFKAFAPLLLNKIAANGNNQRLPNNSVGMVHSGAGMHSVVTNFSQGEIKKTNNEYDLAIQGEGFFEVETANGKRLYTRDGSFERSADGYLVTRDGNKVIGEDNKPIYLGDSFKFEVRQDGTIVADKASGEDATAQQSAVSKIKVVEFENKLGLMKIGNNMYEDPGLAKPKTTGNSRLIQGAVEASNANVIKTMVNSIEGMRTYETLANILDNQSKNLEKAVTQLGRYN